MNQQHLTDTGVARLARVCDDILLPRRAPSAIEEQIDFALANGADVLNAWEEGFLRSIRDWPNSLTKKQISRLAIIVAKVEAAT